MPMALTSARRLRNTDSGVASLSRISQPRFTLISIATSDSCAKTAAGAPPPQVKEMRAAASIGVYAADAEKVTPLTPA